MRRFMQTSVVLMVIGSFLLPGRAFSASKEQNVDEQMEPSADLGEPPSDVEAGKMLENMMAPDAQSKKMLRDLAAAGEWNLKHGRWPKTSAEARELLRACEKSPKGFRQWTHFKDMQGLQDKETWQKIDNPHQICVDHLAMMGALVEGKPGFESTVKALEPFMKKTDKD